MGVRAWGVCARGSGSAFAMVEPRCCSSLMAESWALLMQPTSDPQARRAANKGAVTERAGASPI